MQAINLVAVILFHTSSICFTARKLKKKITTTKLMMKNISSLFTKENYDKKIPYVFFNGNGNGTKIFH